MRCEGYRRYGGAFSLGPVTWEQCKEEAAVIMKCEQEKKVSTFPACFTCWEEAIKTGIKIINVKTIPK